MKNGVEFDAMTVDNDRSSSRARAVNLVCANRSPQAVGSG